MVRLRSDGTLDGDDFTSFGCCCCSLAIGSPKDTVDGGGGGGGGGDPLDDMLIDRTLSNRCPPFLTENNEVKILVKIEILLGLIIRRIS